MNSAGKGVVEKQSALRTAKPVTVSEVKSEVKGEMKSGGMSEVKSGGMSEVKSEVKTEVKTGGMSGGMSEMKSEVNKEVTQQSIEKGETPSVPLTRTSEEKIEPIQYVQHIQKRAPTSQRMMIVACESRVEG